MTRTKRWNLLYQKRMENPQVDAFIADMCPAPGATGSEGNGE